MLVTITSNVIPDWDRLGPVELWIWAQSPFMADDGVMVQSASPLSNGKNAVNVRRITCTVDTGANTLTIPAITDIYSTRDAQDDPYARYSAYFFIPNGTRIKAYESFEDFALPAIANQSWEDIRTYNNAGISALFRDTIVYNRTESDNRYALRGSTIASVGALNGQAKSANGLVIAGGSVYSQTTDATFPGLVSTAAQILAGNKNLTGITQFQNTNVNEGAWSNKGAASLLFSGADSSLASPTANGNPSVTLQTYRSGGIQGVGDSAYNLGMYRTGGPGDSYGLSLYLKVTPDMTGFAAGQYFHEGLHAHTYLLPMNVPGSGVTVTGYHLLKTELATSDAHVRGVGTQIEVQNSSGANASLGVTGNFTVALNIAGGGGWQNTVGIQFEAVKATAFSTGFFPKGDSIFGTVLDLTQAVFHPQGTFSATNGVATITGVGSFATRELAKGDLVSIDGVSWYEIASNPVNDLIIPLTTNYVGNASAQVLTKTVPPLRLIRPSYITGSDQVNTYKLLGIDASNRVRLDNDAQGVFSGANITASNNFTNKITIGAVGGQERYPGLWFGSATISLAGASLLYEADADATILNGTNAVYVRVGNQSQLTFAGSGQVLPSADGQGSIGINGARWGLVRAVTITPGDLIFSDKDSGEELWKMHEDAEFLYVQDYRSGRDVVKFDREGNLYIKGEVRQYVE